MNETEHQTQGRICSDRVHYTQAFLQAIRDLGSLQTEQARAVIEGDPEFSRFDLLIHMANEKKDDAKYALLMHIEQHHC